MSGQLGVSVTILDNSDGQDNKITSTDEDAAKSRNGPNQFHVFFGRARIPFGKVGC